MGSIINGFKYYIFQIKQITPSTEIMHFVTKFIQVRDNNSTLDKLIYVPKSEVSFWNKMDCQGVGWLIPAISERPALFAWPSESCYEFLCGPRFHSEGLCIKSQFYYSDIELLSNAKQLGFNGVIIITKDNIRVLE